LYILNIKYHFTWDYLQTAVSCRAPKWIHHRFKCDLNAYHVELFISKLDVPVRCVSVRREQIYSRLSAGERIEE